MPVDPNASTETYAASNKKHKDCPALEYNDVKVLISREFEKRDNKYETQRGIYTKLGVAIIPLVITFFVYTANLDKRITMLESQNSVIIEMKEDIRTISSRLHSIELLLARERLGEK